MASNTNKTETRRAKRHKNMGRKRKARESRHSTLSEAQLFAGLGEPGKPAPRPAAPPAYRPGAASAAPKA